MNPMQSVQTVFQKYTVFNGRAQRSEFWWYAAAWTAVIIMARMLPLGNALQFVIFLATFLPYLAVTVRRLHDINWSGWIALIHFVPFIGNIAVLVICAFPGTKGQNRHGPDPLSQQGEPSGYRYSYGTAPARGSHGATGSRYDAGTEYDTTGEYDFSDGDAYQGQPEPTGRENGNGREEARTKRYCTECGAALVDGATFCTLCGIAV